MKFNINKEKILPKNNKTKQYKQFTRVHKKNQTKKISKNQNDYFSQKICMNSRKFNSALNKMAKKYW